MPSQVIVLDSGVAGLNPAHPAEDQSVKRLGFRLGGSSA